jgi:hypothetical protein
VEGSEEDRITEGDGKSSSEQVTLRV